MWFDNSHVRSCFLLSCQHGFQVVRVTVVCLLILHPLNYPVFQKTFPTWVCSRISSKASLLPCWRLVWSRSWGQGSRSLEERGKRQLAFLLLKTRKIMQLWNQLRWRLSNLLWSKSTQWSSKSMKSFGSWPRRKSLISRLVSPSNWSHPFSVLFHCEKPKSTIKFDLTLETISPYFIAMS